MATELAAINHPCLCGAQPGERCVSISTGTEVLYYHSTRWMRARRQKEEAVPSPQERADAWTMKWTIISAVGNGEQEPTLVTHTFDGPTAEDAFDEFEARFDDLDIVPLAIGREGGGVLYSIKERRRWELTTEKAQVL